MNSVRQFCNSKDDFDWDAIIDCVLLGNLLVQMVFKNFSGHLVLAGAEGVDRTVKTSCRQASRALEAASAFFSERQASHL